MNERAADRNAREHSDRLLTEREASEILGVASQTLNVWRCTGRYNLPFVRVGRAIRYKRTDLDRFIESNTVTV